MRCPRHIKKDAPRLIHHKQTFFPISDHTLTQTFLLHFHRQDVSSFIFIDPSNLDSLRDGLISAHAEDSGLSDPRSATHLQGLSAKEKRNSLEGTIVTDTHFLRAAQEDTYPRQRGNVENEVETAIANLKVRIEWSQQELDRTEQVSQGNKPDKPDPSDAPSEGTQGGTTEVNVKQEGEREADED